MSFMKRRMKEKGEPKASDRAISRDPRWGSFAFWRFGVPRSWRG
jgi:hypothetical protein